MRYAAALAAIAYLVLGLAAAQQSYDLGIFARHNIGSGFFPFVCGLALAGLAAAEAVSAVRTSGNGQSFWLSAGQGRAAMGIFLVLVIFVLTLDFVGFALASLLLVSGMMKFWGRYRAMPAVAAGLITAVIVHVVFENWLQMPLPKGILGI
jgi:hypothetical protein